MDPHISPAKAGVPARTYIQQLCEDTGCSSEDLPEAMNGLLAARYDDDDITYEFLIIIWLFKI